MVCMETPFLYVGMVGGMRMMGDMANAMIVPFLVGFVNNPILG